MNEPDSPLSLRYEHAFDVRMNFDKRWTFGPISGGADHGYTSLGAGSIVSGPWLNGRLVDYSGADWAVIRPDGVVELNAHYMIEADDGTKIYIRNQGYVHRSQDGIGQDGDGQDGAGQGRAPSNYFRCTPYFRAPEGPHGWLNRTVIVGVGARRPQRSPDDEPDHSLVRYYAIL